MRLTGVFWWGGRWCGYHSDYGFALEDGSAWVDDPRGSYRVSRGGSFGSTAFYLRAASRAGVHPSAGSDVDGFRCARGAP
jgi:formylglycine-generating enzyme required for sulfatase activity